MQVEAQPLLSQESKTRLNDAFYQQVLGLLAFVLSITIVTAVVVLASTTNSISIQTCPLMMAGNDSAPQPLTSGGTWGLKHPTTPQCSVCAESDSFPVWLTPVAICKEFWLNTTTHPLCSGDVDTSNITHVKVCASYSQIGHIQCPIRGFTNLGVDGDLKCGVAV